MSTNKTSTAAEDATITLPVGLGHSPPDRTFPAVIGDFEGRRTSNGKGVEYERSQSALEDVDDVDTWIARITESIGITPQNETWDVTRAVNYQHRDTGSIPNLPHGSPGDTHIVSETLSYEPLGVDFETFEAALAHAKAIIEARSRDGQPNVVPATKDPYRKQLREIRRRYRAGDLDHPAIN